MKSSVHQVQLTLTLCRVSQFANVLTCLKITIKDLGSRTRISGLLVATIN